MQPMAKSPVQSALESAITHQRSGRWQQAEAIYRSILAQEPDNAEVVHMLGVLAAQTGWLERAGELIGRAISLSPNAAAFHNSLGNVLRARGRLDDAIAAYRKAIQLKTDFADPHGNLGNALRDKGLLDEAILAFRKAIQLNPKYVEAHSNLGNALRDKGELDEAIAAYTMALRIDPQRAEVHNNLGNVLKDKGQLDDAISSYSQALRLRPTHSKAHSNLLFTLAYHPDYDAAAILKESQNWDRQHGLPLANQNKNYSNDQNPNRRLRIGYVSPDFREHCQSLFTIPLLSHHNHEAFEIFCYADVRLPDAITDRLRRFADFWRNMVGLNDQQLADMIRADQIDILIDLTMHMSSGRPLLFARKPAPIQIAWLAYPGTTGQSAIDYRLTDPYLDPPGVGDEFYREKSIRLPDTFWCYDPLTTEPKPNALPAKAAGHITFGCLNNFCKVTAPTLSLWTKVLSAIPNSKMLVLASPGNHRQQMLNSLAKQKIDPARIEFVAFQPRRQYLEQYHCIDIGLDTIPYNGHTTSLDSFWMGVPVVTRIGRTIVGRAGWSQLCNLNLRELAAETDDGFVQIATNLAGDLDRLASLRSSLREQMESSPLMDGRRFAANIEMVYREIWNRWCQPGSISPAG
jgi:protein O-GlcNAc transferase